MTLLSVVIPTRNRPDDLRALLESLRANTLPPDEIIVADDYQDGDVLGPLRAQFTDVTFHRLPKRGYITGARNAGWRLSTGRYVFFVDDDNLVAPDCLKLCVSAAERDPQAGVVGAKTLYHEQPELIVLMGVLQGSLALARTTLFGLNETDGPDYETYSEVDTISNAFLVRRELLERAGGFDEDIVQTWSEADFDARIRQLGFRVMVEGRARVWHRGPIVDWSRLSSRHVGGSPFRIYYLMRNRYVYVARYGKWWERVLFGTMFSNIYLAYYVLSMLSAGRWDLVKAALLGAWDGLWYMVTGILRRRRLVG